MSADETLGITCDGCDKDISCDDCYCYDCLRNATLKNKALKNLFSNMKIDDIENVCNLTQLETLTLRNGCA